MTIFWHSTNNIFVLFEGGYSPCSNKFCYRNVATSKYDERIAYLKSLCKFCLLFRYSKLNYSDESLVFESILSQVKFRVLPKYRQLCQYCVTHNVLWHMHRAMPHHQSLHCISLSKWPSQHRWHRMLDLEFWLVEQG